MKDYKNYYRIKAEAQDIFACLTNPVTIELWSGYPAKMEASAGTEFEIWDGDITGKIISIVPDKEIVQQWYFGEQEAESIVTILLHSHKKGTSVELRHTNIPDEDFEDITEGWADSYFGALKEYFED